MHREFMETITIPSAHNVVCESLKDFTCLKQFVLMKKDMISLLEETKESLLGKNLLPTRVFT